MKHRESYISVFVKEMRVQLRIGIHDFEKKAPQTVDVSMEIFADISYLSEVDNSKIIDYARIHDVIQGWEMRDHVDLIETYLKELLALGFSFDQAMAARVAMSKVDIFEKTDAAGLEVFMKRDDYKA